MNDVDTHDRPGPAQDRRRRSLPWRIYRMLASSWLAMVLLVVILICCLVGATAFSYEQASTLIFYSVWFNALLVLLVVNVGCCFFGRIWGRKVTLISFGMILFHLSFVGMFLGIVYNSLFYFRGEMRITEGETLANNQRPSYDSGSKGRFFNLAWLKGETTLVKVHHQYKVDGQNKRYAYELAVRGPKSSAQGIIYATKSLSNNGVSYHSDREGYSVLVVLTDRAGRELYGAHIPLQSLKANKDATVYTYTTGTKDGAGSIPYPQGEMQPLFDLQLQYLPDPVQERAGNVAFKIKPYGAGQQAGGASPATEGTVPLGSSLKVGEFQVSPREIRYWVGMNVNFEPGKPIVLTCLWVGFAGLVITFAGRMRKGTPAKATK